MKAPFSFGSERLLTLAIIFCFCSLFWAQMSFAQQQELTAQRPLITQPVDETQLTVLKGNTHPLARRQFDLGTAPATLPMQRMLLVLKRSAEQESALRKLLDDQQDKASPNYHKWLTPEQYGKQFGPSDADMQTITGWLQSHGFQVGSTKGRTVLEFSGSASQVQEAFHTTIHKYVVNEEQHWANASDPAIPAALTPAVAGVASVNNFPRQPMSRRVGKFSRDRASGKITAASPLFTFQPSFACSADTYCFALGPYDFATIYNVLPLWNAKINGTGQTIAIVGESNINAQDVANFRSLFGLPANSTANGNPLNVILNGPDPGLQGDESEADIDVQWSGAVAPYATIDFVVSQSTETTAGIDLSAVYIVDNNLAPVMSESYGFCELGLGTAGNQFYNTLWQQAAAQGITVFISAGDNGAAGCDDFNAQSPAPAQFGLAVSGYASTPYNVAVGGTDFDDITNPETYWSTTNNSTTQASALGYIPETTWNSSCTNAIFITLGYGSSAEANCNNSRITPYWDIPLGGSGGMSNCTTPQGFDPSSCAGGYAKPSWQAGNGVPNDGKRDLPDVSLFASSGFAGSFYIICQSDQTDGSCNSSYQFQNFLGFGGTSVASPAFAGIMALVNQQTGSRQGNANYVLYKLAGKQSDSTCNSSTGPASTCIFNDITSGTNAMPCVSGSPNCNTSSGYPYGILTGYNAGTGYDQATGLGTVNANNLVTQWSSVTSLPSTTTLNSLTPTTITHGQQVNFNVTVKPQSGSGTAPTGVISLFGGPTGKKDGIGGFNLIAGTASGTTDLLPGGTYSVTAHYPGDSTYGASDSNAISVTVNKESSAVQAFLVTFDSNGNIISNDATTAAYGSPYLLRVNVNNASGQACTPVSSTGATGCPSGSVTMTDNGAALDAGTYTLNSYGYFEDITVQLPGGANSIKAQYAGDNSFNGSTDTQAITITPAPTTMAAVLVVGTQVGSPFQATAYVSATSNGASPTGAVTFFANGTPINGTVSYSGWNGTPYTAQLYAPNFPAAAGTFTVTAAYSGDGNYGASTSPGTQVTVKYPVPTVSFQASSMNVASGTPVTFTALIVSSNNGPNPTGTVQFIGNNTPSIPGAVAYTPVTVNGNADLQAVLTFTPQGTDSYEALYNGDSNYPNATGFLSSSVVITGNDFALTPAQASVTAIAGQQVVASFFVVVQSNTAPITFGTTPCSGLPPETTCSTSVASVGSSTEVPFTIATQGSNAAALRIARSQHTYRWASMFVAAFAGVFVFGIPCSKRGKSCLSLFMFAFVIAMSSCGGGGGGGGGGNQGTPPGTYTVTVTGTSGSGSTAITHTGTFQLVVQQ